MPTTYAIPNGRTVMDATTYTGTNATLNISNADLGSAGFKPDLTWIKVRSTTADHDLVDTTRGISQYLNSSASRAQQAATAGTGLTAFNSNGFTLGTEISTFGSTNASAATYVAWQWNANGGTTSSNTNGSVTSTVQANTTAGFSIVTYTAPTSGAFTVGHGLGVAPAFIITKSTNTAGYAWATYHQSIGNTQVLYLNRTDASATDSTAWNNTSPTSSVFTVGTGWVGSGINYVAYCWAPVAGFSQFGSYTGNGSTDGPFIYTGFQPKFLLIKNTSISGGTNWVLHDTARSTYNSTTAELYPNSSAAEATGAAIDVLSNGFKCRDAGGQGTNSSGGTYIYAAFAANPFKYSNSF